MLGATALLIAAAFGAQDEPSRDLSRLEPIYAEPAGFVPRVGERMRIGSYMPPRERLAEMTQLGVRLFLGEADRFSPPDAGEGPFSLENLAAQIAAAESASARWGVALYSTFVPFEEATAVGEGAVDARSGASIAAWSVWDPERIRYTATRFGKVNRALSDLALVVAGVYGEFGDASFFTGTASPDLMARWQAELGADRPKPAFWSGDPFAKESWKRALEARHGSIAKAYAAWGMTPPDAQAVPLPLDASYPFIARLEYQDWYRAALPHLSATLADIGINIFKDTPVFVPLGPPSDLPELGVDAYRIADSVEGVADGLFVTNVGLYGFAENWAMSLAKIRGGAMAANVPVFTATPFGTAGQFSRRLFEAVSLGAAGVVDSATSILSNRRNLSTLHPGLFRASPMVDVAILHPTSWQSLAPGRTAPPATYRAAAELRDYTDFDMLEESAVAAGALSKYRVAVVFEGTIWRTDTLEAIKAWVEGGGTLVGWDFGKMSDARGSTALYQELFGFGSSLEAAGESLRWDGDVPTAYQLSLGEPGIDDHLGAGWGDADGSSRRALPGATILLPLLEGSSVVTVRLASAPATGRVEFRSGNRLVAGIGLEGGVRLVQFGVESASTGNGLLRLTMTGFDSAADVRIASVEVASDPEAAIAPLVGRFHAPVTLEAVRSWIRPMGKGHVVFAPIKPTGREQYLSVIRHVVYSGSQLTGVGKDPPLIDNRRDRVYVTDLGERWAVFNSNDVPVVWEPRLEREPINIPAGGVRFVERSASPVPILVEAEAFGTEATQPVESPECSPGAGVSAVRVGENKPFEVVLTVPETRTYRLYARTLRNGQPIAVRFRIGEVEAAPVAAVGSGDVYLVGEFTLQAGENTVEMVSDRTFLADFLLASAAPGVVGYRFAPKF